MDSEPIGPQAAGSLPIRTAEAVSLAAARLADAGHASARLEARVLAAFALGVDRSWIAARPEAQLPAFYWDLVARRENHEPLAYITGVREFWGREFLCSPAALIPRQETETLIEEALALEGPRRVLDIGAGTGCLAATLALERPDWEVHAVDVSPEALELARRNCSRLGAQVALHLADLHPAPPSVFDLIVSNPPYIGRDEALPLEVRGHEPALALFAEDSGLAFYRRLAAAPFLLRPSGVHIVEVGDSRWQEAAEAYTERGWSLVRTAKDLGGMERALILTPPKSELP